LSKFGVLKPDGEVLVTVDSGAIFLLDSFLVDFFQNGVAIGNSSDEDTVDKKVGEDGVEASFEPFLGAKHVMKTELG
jgi:hypothetical protein